MIKRRLHPIDQQRRQTFRAWVKWAPMLVLFFGVIFFDAWLSIETRNNDYELNDLKRQQRESLAALETLRVEQAQLESLDVLAVHAPDLGLVPPQPNQVVAVNARGTATGRLFTPIVTAQVEWEDMAGDVGVLLTSQVPKAADTHGGEVTPSMHLDQSMEHLLESF